MRVDEVRKGSSRPQKERGGGGGSHRDVPNDARRESITAEPPPLPPTLRLSLSSTQALRAATHARTHAHTHTHTHTRHTAHITHAKHTARTSQMHTHHTQPPRAAHAKPPALSHTHYHRRHSDARACALLHRSSRVSQSSAMAFNGGTSLLTHVGRAARHLQPLPLSPRGGGTPSERRPLTALASPRLGLRVTRQLSAFAFVRVVRVCVCVRVARAHPSDDEA